MIEGYSSAILRLISFFGLIALIACGWAFSNNRRQFPWRAVLWGLAVGGEDGVRRVLRLLAQDLDVAMAIAGCRTIADVTPALVRPAPR